MTLPYFPFYPGDWMKHPGLRRCSRQAKGAWVDMLCLMFECEDRGVLATGGEPWSDEDIAAAIGGDVSEGLACISELLRKGVAHRNQTGAIFSPEMIRDEQIRRARAKAGRTGGSKTQAKLKQPSKQPSKQTGKQNSSLSVSSSDSVSKETGAAAPDFTDPAIMWSVGKEMLAKCGMTEKNAGTLLGKLARDHGQPKLAAALAQTVTANAANPKDYLIAVLSREQKPRTQAELNRAGKFVL